MEVKKKIKRVIGLFAISAKMDLLWLLRDTRYALAGIAGEAVSNLSVVSGVWLIAIRFGGIGGMSVDEVLFMMSYSTLVTGLFILFGSGNNIHISRIIGRGQLEHLFMQPNSLKMQLITGGFVPFTGCSNFIIGCILLIVSITRLQLQVTLWWMVRLIAHLTATMAIIIARSYLVSTAAFYAPVEAEEISTAAIEGTWQLSTFPLSGMPAFIQVPLLTILPEGLMAWFPALCLLGKPPLNLTEYYPFAYALVLALAAKYFFRKGMNWYVTKGSNRYVPYGFRR
ncbi:MAG TPA: ABC-2 family transporter protein [Clostridia bacterium]